LPNYGDIRERTSCSLMEFKDRKGKQTIPYITYLKKSKISKESALREAEKQGVEIPDFHWVESSSKRKRAVKPPEEIQEQPSQEQPSPEQQSPEKSIENEMLPCPSAPVKKGRGRPQKHIETIDESSLLPENDIKENEGEEIMCKIFMNGGRTYLKSINFNHLYDIDTEDYVGKYNPETKQIEKNEIEFKYDEENDQENDQENDKK